MNRLDKKYQDLLQDILDNGVVKEDRTGTGTISVFGRQIRHNMKQGFPLLTTKKMHWNSIVTELLWFLRGDTNIKFLLDYDCHIWDGDAYKNFIKEVEDIIDGYKCGDIMGIQPHIEAMFSNSDELIPLTKEQFTNKIKTDGEFAKKWGELGPIYGKQWRNWNGVDKESFFNSDNLDERDEDARHGMFYKESEIDQIQNLINELKTNPDSRRLMVNAWAVHDLPKMVLPPCHYGFQVWTIELSMEERNDLLYKKIGGEHKRENCFSDEDFERETLQDCKAFNIPTRAISLMWNQRSVDTFLGLPFNIASYALLLEIIAKEVNMVPDELVGNLGDVHLYSNHIDAAKEQIGRFYTHEERVELLKQSMGEENFNNAVDELMPFGGGMSEYYDSYKIPHTTREPYELPSVEITERNWYQHQLVKEHLGEKTLDEKLRSYRPDCFGLINYQSHSKIKAPLSN